MVVIFGDVNLTVICGRLCFVNSGQFDMLRYCVF